MDRYIKELENKITGYAQSYYEGHPEISDQEFDTLIDKLRSVSPDSEILSKVGWGYDISKVSGKKANHKYQLIGSLEKAKTPDQIRRSILERPFVVSSKLDGLSAVAYYKKGNLVRAISRGNGTTGIDITNKLCHLVPCNIDPYFTGAVRGEILISNDNWNNLRSKYPNAKNQRNVAAGIINRTDISEDIKYVEFVPYNIIGIEYHPYLDSVKHNFLAILDWINDNFNNCVPYLGQIIPEGDDMQELLEYYYGILGKVYPVDGVVITDSRIAYGIDNTVPVYNQQAYKFKSETGETKVKKVNWTLTRTQRLVPVLELEPIELCRATISHATAFNAKYVEDNKIGKDTVVEIERSNEVIPDIQKVVNTPYVDRVLPDKCPVCGKPLSWKGVDLVCNNPFCDNRNIRDLQSWMICIGNTDGISWTLMDKFLTELGIFCIDDIYENPDIRFPSDSGTQKLLFNTVLDKLLKEPVDIVNALCALNIPRLGRVSAEKLATNQSLIERLISSSIDIGKNDTELSSDIARLVGPATANSIMNNLYEKVSKLSYINDRITYKKEESDNKETINVAVTGKLSVKRADFEKELNAAGYVIAPVNKNCKFLITDNPDGSSSKNRKASELGIEKITEAEFRSRYL